MARYIDADSFGRYLNDWHLCETPYAEEGKRLSKTVCATIKACMGALDEEPTADVVPVVHGRWVFRQVIGFGEFACVCAVCGQPTRDTEPDYCPNCGAKMDLEGQP